MTNDNTEAQMREQFEKWVKSQGRGHAGTELPYSGLYIRHDGLYADALIQGWWSAWQASACQQDNSNTIERVQLIHESIALASACVSGLGGNRELTYQRPDKANDLDWADRHISDALDKVERFFA